MASVQAAHQPSPTTRSHEDLATQALALHTHYYSGDVSRSLSQASQDAIDLMPDLASAITALLGPAAPVPSAPPAPPSSPQATAGADASDLRDTAEELLRALAGPHARLRDDQWTAIEALVVHRSRALVVQRTGWGKSAVYFVAAHLMRTRGRGARR